MTPETFIKKIAKETGDAVWKRFGKDGVERRKSAEAFDTLTKADLMAEKLVIANIKKHFPEHGIVAEESGADRQEAEYVWTIDPIDGTTNFALGIPFFCVMVALMKHGDIVLAVIYLPATKELYFAKKGKGTFLNGKRIHCSQRATLEGSHGISTPYLHKRDIALMKKLFAARAKSHFIHALGSKAGFCYVARGTADWKASFGGALHDFTAPYLILKESGCAVTNAKGKPWTVADREMVAANPRLHKKLIALTKNV